MGKSTVSGGGFDASRVGKATKPWGKEGRKKKRESWDVPESPFTCSQYEGQRPAGKNGVTGGASKDYSRADGRNGT